MINKKLLTLVMVNFTVTLLFSASILNGQEAEEQPAEPAQQRAVMENGKLFIIGDDGEKQAVDTSGARSVAIQQSSKIVEQNGERVEVSGGTATIVDANGEKTVIEFDTGDGNGNDIQMPWLLHLADGSTVWRANRGPAGKFMLGMHCSPVDDRLRGHLQLDEGMGLVIDEVSPDSPASTAELEKDDILLFADDQAIGTQEELSQVVELAGEEERSLAMTFIRDGEERSTEITPVKRPPGQAGNGIDFHVWGGGNGGEQIEELMKKLQQNNGFPELDVPLQGMNIEAFGPGIVIPGPGGFDPEEMRARMDEQLEQMRAEMEEMRMNIEKQMNDR